MRLDQGTGGIKVIIEVPQIYRERNWRGDPNDLIDETITVGALVMSTLDAEQLLVRPHAWKGNVPKEIHNRRVRERLTDVEWHTVLDCGCPASLRHNVIDATGMCLWQLGRLK
jgi:hypothetical protein